MFTTLLQKSVSHLTRLSVQIRNNNNKPTSLFVNCSVIFRNSYGCSLCILFQKKREEQKLYGGKNYNFYNSSILPPWSMLLLVDRIKIETSSKIRFLRRVNQALTYVFITPPWVISLKPPWTWYDLVKAQLRKVKTVLSGSFYNYFGLKKKYSEVLICVYFCLI